MLRLAILIYSITVLPFLWCSSAHAHSFGFSTARMASRVTTHAVEKSVSYAFKPKLKITRNKLGTVSTAALSEDQNLLVIGMDEGSTRVWDLLNGQQWMASSPNKQGSKITCVDACSLTGKIVSANAQGHVTLYEPEGREQSTTLSSPALAMRFISSSEVLGVTQAGVFFLLHTDDFHVSQVYKTRGELLKATITKQVVVTRNQTGAVTSYSTPDLIHQKNIVPQILADHTTDMALSPNGTILYTLSGKQKIVAIHTQSAQKIFQIKPHRGLHQLVASNRGCAALDNRNMLYFFPLKKNEGEKIGELPNSPSTLILDNAGNHIMTGFPEGVLQLWSVQGRELLATLISTRKGWAVVDQEGRFTGTESGQNDVAWAGQQKNEVIPIGNVASAYYEPGLIPKLLKGESLGAVESVEDGLTLPPQVAIQAQAEGQRAVVTVRGVESKGGGVQDIRLYQNGKRVSESNLVDFSVVDGKERRVEIQKKYSVPVLSQNLLSAIALNSEMIESPPAQFILNSKGNASQPSRTLHILTIGIDGYDDPNLQLLSAASDADSIDALFSNVPNTFFQRKHYTLRNKEATRKSIESKLSDLQSVKVDDAVLIYLTGHGLSYNNKWYYLSRTATLEKLPDDLPSLGISAESLQQKLTEIPADQILLIIDACQAGGALPPAHRFAGLSALRTVARLSGIHILAATNKEQDALEVDALGHGLLTYSILQGLKGNADLLPRDNKISVREMMNYTAQTVPLLSNKYGGYRQYPTAFSRGYDFYIKSSQ